jgi:MoaA/NifB/PqqE/SkfB family radical SAM enzyme
VADGRARVRNLERRGTVPLFADDLTVDVDGRGYRTNLVLADRVTGPLLPRLRVDLDDPAPIPGDLADSLRRLLPPAVRRSNRRVDAALDRFVAAVRAPAPAPRRRRGVRPRRLEFHLSYACDNHCQFCSEDDRLARWRSAPVTAREVRRTLSSHARAGGDHVLFTGGEPTLHPALVHALQLARSLGMRTAIGTSGQRLGDKTFAARVLPYLDELSLSLHGADAASHDDATGRLGSFEQLMAARGHAAALAPHLPVAANAVITRRNVGALPEIVALCAEKRIDRLLVSSVAPEGAALRRYRQLVVPLERWRDLAPEAVARGDDAGVRLRFFGLPLCALGDARVRSNDLYYDARVTVERSRGPRGSVRLGHVVTRYPRRGRRWTRRCRPCRYREVCGGVFRAYVERFGDDEIRPIQG